MTEETKLLPCPFCGGEVTQHDTNRFHCGGGPDGLCFGFTTFAHCSVSSHALRLWNKRALSPPEPTEKEFNALLMVSAAIKVEVEKRIGPQWVLDINDWEAIGRAALRAMPLQDGAITQDKHHD